MSQAPGRPIDTGYCYSGFGAGSFPLSGNYNINSGVINQGSNGNWWTSTATSTTNANNLEFNADRVIPQNNNNRGNGFSVRCLAR